MITIGVDFHKHSSSYRVLDEDGNSIKSCKLKNDPATISRFLNDFNEPIKLAMEATRSWNLYYETVKDQVEHFMLGHPKKMKALTESEFKNDKNDARMIAELAHMGFLPQAHISTTSVREIRSLVRHRAALVDNRRAIRNQVQTLIDRNVWPCQRPQSFKNLFCKRGRTWLVSLQLPERERYILDHLLAVFDQLSEHISQAEWFIKSQESDMPGLEYLRTVPGFQTSKINAYTVLVEASDITRFKKANGFTHYAGLVPRERSSGDKHRNGRLIKSANMYLRTAIIESTFAAIRKDRGLQAYYKQKKARCGSGDAVIATARKLACAIYSVLKEQRPYTYESQLHPSAAACHSSSVA